MLMILLIEKKICPNNLCFYVDDFTKRKENLIIYKNDMMSLPNELFKEREQKYCKRAIMIMKNEKINNDI